MNKNLIKAIDAEMVFFSAENEGRSTIPMPGYMPHFVIKDDTEYLGIRLIKTQDDIIFDRPTKCTIELLYYPNVDYSKLRSGVLFEVREGPKIIGSGRIISEQYEINI